MSKLRILMRSKMYLDCWLISDFSRDEFEEEFLDTEEEQRG